MMNDWESRLKSVEKELELAARIQSCLLPQHDPLFGDYDISGEIHSCHDVGGDYFDYIPIDDARLGVVIADVSGKGVGAALLMATLRGALRFGVHAGYDLAGMFARLNDFTWSSTATDTFITLFYAELNTEGGSLRYINAGHPEPLVMHDGLQCCSLPGTGLALGMFPGTTFEVETEVLKPGDMILLFTDGIVEGRDRHGREFAPGRLESLLLERSSQTASDLVKGLSAEVKRHVSGSDQCDDMTLVAVKRRR